MGFKMWKSLASVLIFIFSLQATILAQKNKLKFCTVDDTLSHEMKSSIPCSLLVDSNNREIECIITIDRATCLRYLINNVVNFMIAEPEDLMILAMTENYNKRILVTHELGVRNGDPFGCKMVVIVRKDIKDIWHTEKKRFCAAGFEPGLLTRDYVKFFQDKLLPRECDPEKSLLENRMSSLSQYFESACISGPWTIDHKYDKYLKKKYSNLCSQCGNSIECSSMDTYFGKSGALRCLIAGKGDVTWAKLDSVQQHLVDNQDKMEYSFLCPDGRTRNLTDHPCIWLEEPKLTIIVGTDAAEELRKFIKNPENTNDVWRLFVGRPGSIEIPETPLSYLKRSYPEYYSMKDYAKCKPDRSINWCVTTDIEAEKCKWLSFASRNHGIEPLIKCIKENSRMDCMESVKRGTSDIFAAQPHENMEARKIGLKSVVHMGTNKLDGNVSAALIRKFSNFTSLKDLRNHKACFSGYRDFGWNSFIYMMRKLTGDNAWYSKDKEMVSKFFNESCVLNLHEINGTEKDFPKNLYSLCSHRTLRKRNPSVIVERFEVPQIEDLEHADKEMLNCMNYNKADVAFINLSSLIEIYPDMEDTSFKVLCLNESTKSSDDLEQCHSTQRTLGSLMIHENVTEARKDEIYLMLMDMDRIFGITYQFRKKSIYLYGPFNGFSGIIFPKDTQYLDRENCDSRCNLNYDEILKDFSTYQLSPNKSNSLKQEVYFAIILLFNILSISFLL